MEVNERVKIISGVVYTYKNRNDYRSFNSEVFKRLENGFVTGLKHVIIDGDTVYEQYIEGRILSEFRDCDFNDKLIILKKLCDSIIVLHDLGIIHRDIKPDNIIVTDSFDVYLIDYDISRIYGVDEEKRRDTTLFGTDGYAPPEQYGFMTTDFRSDIFGLGKVIEGFCDDIRMDKIVRKCCELDINRRYESVAQVKENLDKINSRGINFKHFDKQRKISVLIMIVFMFSIVFGEVEAGESSLTNFIYFVGLLLSFGVINLYVGDKYLYKFNSVFKNVLMTCLVYLFISAFFAVIIAEVLGVNI